MHDKIRISSRLSVARGVAYLALFQHFVETYLNEKTGDLRVIPDHSYDRTTVHAIVSMVIRENKLWIDEDYLGAGGYTDAYHLAQKLVNKYYD